jgi:phage FluMu protein Com
MAAPDKFVLMDTTGRGDVTFQYFPERIQTSARANWEPQDALGGMKPIIYGNREPMKANDEGMIEIRCKVCKRLLLKISNNAVCAIEIKCKRCERMNMFKLPR